jgi:hypothetical protein
VGGGGTAGCGCGGGCEWFTDVGCWSVDDVFRLSWSRDSIGEFWAISDLWRSLEICGDLLEISGDL